VSKRIVLVIGGGGYVGSELVDHLLNANYEVRVFDTFWYGRGHFDAINNSNLKLIAGDVRDVYAIKSALVGVSDVIHLACISNDPSFDKDINKSKPIVLFCLLLRIDQNNGKFNI
jgi:nucleoside-diphosphate-sugar epimerase